MFREVISQVQLEPYTGCTPRLFLILVASSTFIEPNESCRMFISQPYRQRACIRILHGSPFTEGGFDSYLEGRGDRMDRSQQTSSVKGWLVNILGFMHHVVSVATIQFCWDSMKTGRDNTSRNEHAVFQ